MRAALTIAARDLVGRFRDRSALIVGFVAPVALALVIAFATGGGSDGYHARLGVVDADGGDVARRFVVEVLGSDAVQDVFTVREYPSRDAAERALDAGEANTVLVVHPNLERITVITSPSAQVAGEIAASIAESFAAQLAGVGRAIGLSVMVDMFGAEAFDGDAFRPMDPRGGAPDPFDPAEIDAEALAQAVADAPLPIDLVDASAGASGLATANYFGPGMAMLFVFFLLSAAPRSLLREAEAGTLARLRAAPIPTASIVAGKALAVGALGLTSMCVVWFVTAKVFGVGWGDPVAVLALMLAFVVAALGITTLASVYAQTEAQADGFVSIVAFLMAMLGGNFLFLGDLPRVLQQVARFTPNGWALQGFMTLTADGGGLRDVLGPIVAILAFAIAAFAAALPGLRAWTTA